MPDRGFDQARNISDTVSNDQRSANRMGVIAGTLGTAAVIGAAVIAGGGGEHSANASQVDEVGLQTIDQRVDINRQLIMASKPDRIEVGTLIIDWREMPADHGARRGSFILDDKATGKTNNVEKSHIKKINGVPVDTSSGMTTITNATEIFGQGNDGIGDYSKYVEFMAETDLDSHPIPLDITINSNTFPAVYFKDQPQPVDVLKIEGDNVLTKNPTGTMSFSEVNITTEIPTGSHPIATAKP